MKQYDFQFDSIGNNIQSPKKITVTACAPDKLNAETGAMMFCHGWGSSRYAHIERMQETADKYNLFCISPEYRMSGYDYDPITGSGWYKPYDLSFYQLFDLLLALRFALDVHPELNRRRIFVYGTSQGGHIAMLSAAFAPKTFAAVYSSSGLTCVPDTEKLFSEADRVFSDAEKKIRSVPYLIDRIEAPLFLEHGTADNVVDWQKHTANIVKLMQERGKFCEVVYYEGGDHQFQPTITKTEAFWNMTQKFLGTYRNENTDDFTAKSKIVIPCGERTLSVDWGKAVTDPEFMSW